MKTKKQLNKKIKVLDNRLHAFLISEKKNWDTFDHGRLVGQIESLVWIRQGWKDQEVK